MNQVNSRNSYTMMTLHYYCPFVSEIGPAARYQLVVQIRLLPKFGATQLEVHQEKPAYFVTQLSRFDTIQRVTDG